MKESKWSQKKMEIVNLVGPAFGSNGMTDSFIKLLHDWELGVVFVVLIKSQVETLKKNYLN